MRTGRLIVFEGPEGAGKTTQLALLEKRLRSAGIDVHPLREPGGTSLGDSIRALLLDPAQQISGASKALLFMASRAQLVRDEVDPGLDRGVIILMDRFFLTTYAYQIDGRGLPEDQIRSANALATGGLIPDLTLILEMTAAEGMARASQRGEQDRIERLGDEFHSRVERAFTRFAGGDWQVQHPEAGPIVGIDARGQPADVHERVVRAIAQAMPDRFGTLVAGKSS